MESPLSINSKTFPFLCFLLMVICKFHNTSCCHLLTTLVLGIQIIQNSKPADADTLILINDLTQDNLMNILPFGAKIYRNYSIFAFRIKKQYHSENSV